MISTKYISGKSSMMAWQRIVRRYPKMQGMDWQSFKLEDSTFYFVRNHFESIGKPVLSKGG